MPTYCYSNAGRVQEAIFRIGEAPRSIIVDGEEYDRDFAAERKGFPPRKGWPMECFASGVNAAQAGDLRSHLANAGVPTDVTSDGNPVYRDANHRRRALAARGLVDKAGYR